MAGFSSVRSLSAGATGRTCADEKRAKAVRWESLASLRRRGSRHRRREERTRTQSPLPGSLCLLKQPQAQSEVCVQITPRDPEEELERIRPTPHPLTESWAFQKDTRGNDAGPQGPLLTDPRGRWELEGASPDHGTSLLWASAPLSLTLQQPRRARQGNESKTYLGADPTGSRRQVASSEKVLDGLGAKSLTLRAQTEMERWEGGEKQTSLAAGGSWKQSRHRNTCCLRCRQTSRLT